MLVSNEIERPITVNIRPRKSRHGGVSTEIVSKEKAKATNVQTPRAPEKRSRSEMPGSSGDEKPARSKKSGSGGGLLKKVFGRA